jgi:hypothetical protein
LFLFFYEFFYFFSLSHLFFFFLSFIYTFFKKARVPFGTRAFKSTTANKLICVVIF